MMSGDEASREDLLVEFRQIRDDLGHFPRPYELRDTDRYSVEDYFAEFLTWTDVVEAAEFQARRADVIAETRRIQRELGRTPTASKFGDHSFLEQDCYKQHFDSWQDVLEAADAFPSADEIIQNIRDLAQDSGPIPNSSEFVDETPYQRDDYLHHFDSWEDALSEADLFYGKDDVTPKISQLQKELGRTPTEVEFNEWIDVPASILLSVFDSWSEAVEAANAFPERDDVASVIRRVNREIGWLPTPNDVTSRTNLRRIDYQYHFDSWEEALEAANVIPDERNLADEIAALAAETDRIPTKGDLYGVDDCLHQFDSWEEALEAAGVLPSKAELISEIRRIKNEQGYETLFSESIPENRFPRSYYQYRFGGWGSALEAADVRPSEQELIDEIRRLAWDKSTVPTRETVLSETNFLREDYIRNFGLINQAIEVAVKEVDPSGSVGDAIVPEEKHQRLEAITANLGRPPTESYVRRLTDLAVDPLLDGFSNWDAVLEATGLDADEADITKDMALDVETVCEQLEHRPNVEEVQAYISDEWSYTTTTRIRKALEVADVPNERDLSPTHSLTRQKYERNSDDIPSHTDLLTELNVIRSRADSDLEEAFENRGVIDERHYDIQFGSLSKAIDALESIDTREFREPREHTDSVPGPILSDSVEELAEILERPPLLEEVLFFGDASPSDFARAFESWSQVADAVERSEGWSNEELLTELEYVGRQLGKPPTPTEMTEYSSHPTQCYLRRFGSWPNTLSLVGVDTEHIPEEYLGFRRTARLWDVTDYLIDEEFGHRAALLDELYRLAFELGREPTAHDIRSYSPYATTTFEREFGSVEDALAILEGPFEYDGSPPTDPTESDLLEELGAVNERSTEWILPQDICLHSRYSPGTFLGIFGSLEAALEEADLPTDHLHGQTATYGDIWNSDHQVKTGILREIQRLTSKHSEPPTMVRISTVDGIDQNVIYRYFDSWDDAREAAGVISSSKRVSDMAIESETTDNPEFVNDLMSEISEMMDDSE